MKTSLHLGLAVIWLLSVLVLVGGPSAVFAQAGSLTVTVRCQPNPEQITIRNSTGAPLTIQRIDSTGGADVAGEPIEVGNRLPNAAVIPNGQTVIYENGPNAAGNVLLTEEIFDDANLSGESLTLTTDRGTFTVSCGTGTNTQTLDIGQAGSPAPVSPAQASPAPASPAPASPAPAVGAQVTASPGAATITTPVPGAAQPAQQTPIPIVTPTPTPASPVPAGRGTVNGIVFNDLNQNGLFEAGEPGVGGATLTLRSAGPDGSTGTADDVTVATAQSGNDGRYTFTNVAPAVYAVTRADLPNYVATTSNPVTITVAAGQTVTANFGVRASATASAAPAQAGGLPPLVLLPIALILLGLGLGLGRRATRSA